MPVESTPPPPRFPRAPSQAAWDAMTPTERRAVVEALPAEMTEMELMPSEGDAHFDAKSEGRDTLRTFSTSTGKRIYVASELTVYYPEEDRFSPDLLAVCDVDPHAREKWVVSDEGKGLDWALEVLVSGSRWKDQEKNRVRYARLRIPEYFVYDRKRNLLRGWRPDALKNSRLRDLTLHFRAPPLPTGRGGFVRRPVEKPLENGERAPLPVGRGGARKWRVRSRSHLERAGAHPAHPHDRADA